VGFEAPKIPVAKPEFVSLERIPAISDRKDQPFHTEIIAQLLRCRTVSGYAGR
jgi:hypothetical protein